jgi:N-acetylglucosaminyldiphosphoundecaprenol N-acetyl-beta-D-mannosaminyltransferase
MGAMKHVFGINFSSLTQQAIVDLVTQDIPNGSGPRLVVTTNLDHVVNLTRRADYRAAYGSAWISTADGWPVYLYARLRGVKLPARVTGADLVQSLFGCWDPARHRVFMIGSNQEACERLTRQLTSQGFNPSSVAWIVPPLGFEYDDIYSTNMAQQVAQHGTTHLLMGIGSPKSEVWVHQNRRILGGLYAFGLGAGLDFLAGTQRRAPPFMRRIGMEWFWRLAQEPRRLAPRYLLNSWRFLMAIAKDLQSPMPLSLEGGDRS